MAIMERKEGKGFFAVVNYRAYDGARKQVRKYADKRRDAENIEQDFLNRRDALYLPGQKPPVVPIAEPTALTVAAYLEAC